MSKFDSIYKSIQEDIVEFLNSNGAVVSKMDLESGEIYDFTDLESSLADYINEYRGHNYQEALDNTYLPEIIGDLIRTNSYVFIGDEVDEIDLEDEIEDLLYNILGSLEY